MCIEDKVSSGTPKSTRVPECGKFRQPWQTRYQSREEATKSREPINVAPPTLTLADQTMK